MASSNSPYNTERIALGKCIPLSAPFSVTIDSSEACNLRCNYCFRGEHGQKSDSFVFKNEIMKWDLFTLIMDQLAEFPEKVKKISLNGHGEPLCNKRLPDMVRYINKNYSGCLTEMHTNATLLTEEYARDLADSNPWRIIIGIQGINAEKYKKVCEADIDFENFVNSIRILYENKRDTVINIKIVDSALDKGEEDIFYSLFTDISDNINIEKALPLWRNVEYPDGIQTDDASTNKYGYFVPYQKSCVLPFYYLWISPSGDVYPCNQPEMRLNYGNVKKTSLVECWNGDLRKNHLITQLRDGRDTIPDCKGCYIAQNSIMLESDSLNGYQEEALKRFL